MDFIRSIARRLADPPPPTMPPEGAEGDAVAGQMGRRSSLRNLVFGGRRSQSTTRRAMGMTFEPRNNLEQFRLLVGIITHSTLLSRGMGFSIRPAENTGIYGEVIQKENKAKKSFKNFSRVINFCLGAQIVVAATLTALGAGGVKKGPIVVFGAINTVIAGFLTYLKGSGLPNRIKYFQHEWDNLRAYIESRERDLMCDDYAFDVFDEIRTIRELFEAVKADVESNTPDRFVSSGRTAMNTSAMQNAMAVRNREPQLYNEAAAKVSQFGSGVNGQLGSAIQRPAQAVIARETDFEKQATDEANRVSSKIDSGVRFLGRTLSGLHDKIELGGRAGAQNIENQVSSTGRDLGDLEKQIESHGKQSLGSVAHDIEARGRGLGDIGSQILSHGRDWLRPHAEEVQTQVTEAEHMRADAINRLSSIKGDAESIIDQLRRENRELSRLNEDLRSSQVIHPTESSSVPTVIQREASPPPPEHS